MRRTTIENVIYPDAVVDLAIRFKIELAKAWEIFTYMESVMEEEDYTEAVQLASDALMTLRADGLRPRDEFFTEMAKLFIAV